MRRASVYLFGNGIICIDDYGYIHNIYIHICMYLFMYIHIRMSVCAFMSRYAYIHTRAVAPKEARIVGAEANYRDLDLQASLNKGYRGTICGCFGSRIRGWQWKITWKLL